MIIITIVIIILILGLSVRWNWWRSVKKGVAILMYHKVGIPPKESKLKKLWVSPAMFNKQMKYLEKNGYNVMTFRDLKAMADAGKEPGPKTVIITFDDGYKNNFLLAVPVLSECGFPCTIFVVAEAIGRDNFWHDPSTETRVDMMNEREIVHLLQRDFEIGSHTRTHKDLGKIPLEQAEKEIIESRKMLEDRLKTDVKVFAHPYGGGAFKKDIQDIIKKAGYDYAVSIKQGLASFDDNPYTLKRIFVHGSDNMFDFYLNLTRGKSRL